MGALLPSPNHASLGSSRLREIADPLTWASCFLAFMATSLEEQDARDLAAYGMIVLQLARKHGGSRWLLYDRQFRQHKAAGAAFPWADINPSLMDATVLGQAGDGSGRSFPLCLSSDHFKEDCALLPLEQPRPRPPAIHTFLPAGRTARRPTPYQASDSNVCRRFNRGYCSSLSCRFEHTCLSCSKPGHGEVHCPDGRTKSGVSRAKSGEPRVATTAPKSTSCMEKL